MTVSEIIKEIMDENSLSQDNLALILDVSQKSISNWLNEKSVPTFNGILSIYRHFGITPNELLGIEEPKNFKRIL